MRACGTLRVGIRAYSLLPQPVVKFSRMSPELDHPLGHNVELTDPPRLRVPGEPVVM